MEKDKTEESVVSKDTDVSIAVASFVKDPTAWFLYKRSEKISKAFFLLTRHLPEDNLLKNQLRATALNLLAKSQGLLSNLGSVHDKAQEVVLETLSLISLSDTAFAAESLSERNHSIVMKELGSFIENLSTWSNQHAASSYIPASLFDMSGVTLPTPLSVPAPLYHTATQPSPSAPSKKVSGRDIASPKKADIRTEKDVSDMRKNNRQESILQAIGNKREVSIKDLVAVVKGCSEKTIQRELIALVNAGTLSKTGERRWSRYSIVSR